RIEHATRFTSAPPASVMRPGGATTVPDAGVATTQRRDAGLPGRCEAGPIAGGTRRSRSPGGGTPRGAHGKRRREGGLFSARGGAASTRTGGPRGARGDRPRTSARAGRRRADPFALLERPG